MKSSIVEQKPVSDNLKDQLGLEVYPVTESSVSMVNDPTVRKRTEEAKKFLQKAGLPDFKKFRSK